MAQKQNRLYPLDRIRNISAGRLGTILRIRAKGAPLIYCLLDSMSKGVNHA